MRKSILIKSSLLKKYWMALTGLFLCTFLLGHVLGNLQLFIPDSRLQFNAYAQFMTTNPLVKVLSYLTYFSILFHAIDGILLTLENRNARPIAYSKQSTKSSAWSSRNMGVLGSIVLIFIVMHLSHFWAQMHFGLLPLDENGHKDLYKIVFDFFRHPSFGIWMVLLYVVAMLGLALHLYHGFFSAFQSLGLRHQKYTPWIHKIGLFFAVLVPMAFAAMPLYIYFTQ